MKHQYLQANIEAQVTTASIILAGVYVLIILEVSHVLYFDFIFPLHYEWNTGKGFILGL